MHNEPGHAPPVFVDRTGRRRRLTLIAGTAMGLGLLVSFALILAGLFFDAPARLPGWSDSRPGQPIEAGLDGQDERVDAPSGGPSPVTSTTQPVQPSPQPVASTSAGSTPAGPPAAQPSRSDQPGQGDERRSTPKPGRSPGKPS